MAWLMIMLPLFVHLRMGFNDRGAAGHWVASRVKAVLGTLLGLPQAICMQGGCTWHSRHCLMALGRISKVSQRRFGNVQMIGSRGKHHRFEVLRRGSQVWVWLFKEVSECLVLHELNLPHV